MSALPPPMPPLTPPPYHPTALVVLGTGHAFNADLSDLLTDDLPPRTRVFLGGQLVATKGPRP